MISLFLNYFRRTHVKLLDDPPEKALAEKNLNAHGEKP